MLKKSVQKFYVSLCVIWALGIGFLKVFLAPIRSYVQGGQYRSKSYVQIDGKIAVITGGVSGPEIAVDLARRGAKVIVGMENAAVDGQNLIEEIADRTGSTNVVVLELNVTSFASVRTFVQNIRQQEDHLDILINSAGTIKLGTDDDGIERILKNHYGHFLLTLHLLDLIKKSSSSRIINLSSKLHKYSRKFWDNKPHTSKAWDSCPFRRYLQCELASVIFTNILDRKLPSTTVNCYHEGYTAQQLLPKFIVGMMSSPLEFFFKTPRSAAQTAIRLAVDPDLAEVSGKFFSDCEKIDSSDVANNNEAAEWLWKNSLEVTGVGAEDLPIFRECPEFKEF